MATRVGVLALQGATEPHLRTLASMGVPAVAVRTAEALDDLDGLVIPGGESTTLSMLLQRTGLDTEVRRRFASGMGLFGTCAGMILCAAAVRDGRADQLALGAIDLTVRRNAFGRQVDSFEADLDVAGISDGPGGAPVRAVFIRAPWIEEAGPDVEVLARIPDRATDGTALGEAAGKIVAARSGCLLATSFHPEVTGDWRVHSSFVRLVTASRRS